LQTLANYYPFTQTNNEPNNNFCSGFDFTYEIQGNTLTMQATVKAMNTFDDYSSNLQTDPTSAQFGYGLTSNLGNGYTALDGTYSFQAAPNGAKVRT